MFAGPILFVDGATFMGFAVGGLFFLRFWRRTGDRFFIAFAGAFWLLALQSATVLGNIPDEARSWTYLLRLGAFLLIIAAIMLKNRRGAGLR
jgi:hypothetical protein